MDTEGTLIKTDVVHPSPIVLTYKVPAEHINTLISWDVACRYLEYCGDRAFGTNGFVAWTENYVITLCRDGGGTIRAKAITRNPAICP